MNKFIIDIAPLAPLPIGRKQFFSYLWNEEIPTGALVSVPFFRRNLEGVVIGSHFDFRGFENMRLKKINRVLEKNFLDEKQLELARFVSDYYYSPLGIVLKAFIPKRINARTNNQKFKKAEKKKFVLTKEQASAIKKIAARSLKFRIENFKFLLYGPASSGKTEIYINAILKIRQKNPEAQFLVLLPELTLVPQAVERYSALFKTKEIVLLHSKISKGRFYSAWQKIKSGSAKIIIGSRMAVFAPFQKLGLIVIDEEQDASFKQWEMSPRYDARKTAEKLAKIHKCPIIFGSATPSINSYYRSLEKEIDLIKLPPLKPGAANDKQQLENKNKETLAIHRLPPIAVELIDMRKEKWRKNHSPVSKNLQSEVVRALKNKSQVILFVNRQGFSFFSVCAHCKNVLRCPQCDRALIYNLEGYYKCPRCSHKTDIFPACRQCQGTNFRNIGVGTQQIEKEISKMFAGARLKRIDSETVRKSGEQEKIYLDFSEGKIDILIGTQMITKGWDLPNVSLIGIIDTDSLFNFPDFNAAERTFQHLAQIAGRAARTQSRVAGKVIMQTYHPEHPIIQAAVEMDYHKFYQSEITIRKSLFYPPFGQIIKIIKRDRDKNKVERETEKFYQVLQKNFDSSDIFASYPQDPLVSKVGRNFQKQIIIKIKKADILKNLSPILRKLGKGWIIDVDPISIN